MEGDNQDFQVFQNSKIFSTKYLAELHPIEEDRIHQSFIGIQRENTKIEQPVKLRGG